MNSNLICRQMIMEEEFLPSGNELVVVKHPATYHCHPNQLTYERRPESTAWVPYNYGGLYVLGGINGGCPQTYCKMIRELKQRIDIDLQRGIVAIWHDESHLNRYIIEGSVPVKVLDSDYGWPEDWNLPFEKKIEILEKRKYIDIDKIKLGLK